MTHIALFTSFPPTIGGGGTILRSLIPELKQPINWFYLAEAPSAEGQQIGTPLMGGSFLKDVLSSSLLWSLVDRQAITRICQRLLAADADLYWIVGHNEGILVARELSQKKPVHLTIHDDVPSLFALSRRYRHLQSLARQRLKESLLSAASIDVISEEMQQYYQAKLGIKSVVIHRYLSQPDEKEQFRSDQEEIRIGHIGKLYSLDEFRVFANTVRKWSEQLGRPARIIMFGCQKNLSGEFPETIVDRPNMEESKALVELRQCHFTYASHLFSSVGSAFRQTSVPTKLSSYVMAKRPIFGHAPESTATCRIIEQYNLGLNCYSLEEQQILDRLDELLRFSPTQAAFERARQELFGQQNIKRLRDCLGLGPG